MNEAEYQVQRESLLFDIQIYNGLIGGLIAIMIAITACFSIAIGGGVAWYFCLPIFVVIMIVLVACIRGCLRAIKNCENGLKDLIQPFGLD